MTFNFLPTLPRKYAVIVKSPDGGVWWRSRDSDVYFREDSSQTILFNTFEEANSEIKDLLAFSEKHGCAIGRIGKGGVSVFAKSQFTPCIVEVTYTATVRDL